MGLARRLKTLDDWAYYLGRKYSPLAVVVRRHPPGRIARFMRWADDLDDAAFGVRGARPTPRQAATLLTFVVVGVGILVYLHDYFRLFGLVLVVSVLLVRRWRRRSWASPPRTGGPRPANDSGATRVETVAFELGAVSAATRTVVCDLLTATLASTDITDQDIEIYVGCTRTELARAAALWAESSVMPLADAEYVWMVLANAIQRRPWRSRVPAFPPDETLRAARDELEQPIHGRVTRLHNE